MNKDLPSEPEVTEALAKAERRHKTAPRARAVVEQARPPEEDLRAEDARAPEGGARLQRRSRRHDDQFYVDPALVPPGMSYEWKRESVYGQPDEAHQIELRENHWKPVPADRHPSMVMRDKDGTIRRQGMILMERPAYLTKEAEQEDLRNAIGQVQSVPANQMARTPEGQFTRNHPSVKAVQKLKRGYSPIDIPE